MAAGACTSFLVFHEEITDKGTSVTKRKSKKKNTLFIILHRDAATSVHNVSDHISVKLKECYHTATSFNMLHFCLLVKTEV